jgi:serine protease Do
MNDRLKKGLLKNKRFLSFLMVLFVLALGIGIGTLVSYHVGADGPDSQLQMQSDGKPVAGGALLAFSQAFEEASRRVEPAVVNINTEELVSSRRGERPSPEDEEDLLGPYLNPFGGPLRQMPEQMAHSLGSGVIVDPKGYIITNNHVVESATKIKVSVSSGEEYTARLIGTDPVSDIAVIKINGSKPFPFAKVGNSKNMKVGDWVIAIGSPFGLEQTVTAGIISTTGRTFPNGGGPSEYSVFNEYLQTDAAINRGNSGGPLVNMNGEVVGINSFISTPTGASAGVGFAVPSHLFVRVYNQVLDGGKVARGFVGISMNPFPFTPAMAEHFGVKQGSGVLVTQLVDAKNEPSESGPAAKAGIKVEDVIVAFDGNKITNMQEFRMAVANAIPGKKVPVKVVRHGQEKDFEIVIAERQFEKQEKSRYSFEEDTKPKTEIGLEFDNITPRIAKVLGITGGAYITSVKPGSLADDAGLSGPIPGDGGDVIVEANGKPVNNKDDLFNIVKGVKNGSSVVLKFMRIFPKEGPATYFTSIVKP